MDATQLQWKPRMSSECGLMMAKVPLAGTTYIPGVSEERALQEMKDMMAKQVAEIGRI